MMKTMDLKFKKRWMKINKVVSDIAVTGFPPFNQIRYEIAVLKKETVVLVSVKVLDSKTHKPISITNSYMYGVKIPRPKTIAQNIFDVLCDCATHELGEHFYFRNENCFDQHLTDKRYKNKKITALHSSYKEWYEIALKQRAEMEKCNA